MYFSGPILLPSQKLEELDWFALKPSILAGIMEHFASGLPVVETVNRMTDMPRMLLIAKLFNKSSSCLIQGCVRLLLWMAATLFSGV